MKANQADFPVRSLCRVLRVSASGYYDWRDRALSTRARANVELMERISQIHQASDTTYGAPRIHAELAEQGVAAGHNRIARLMCLHGLRGVSRRRGWCVTTRRDPRRLPAPDLVQRRFEATDINQLWQLSIWRPESTSIRGPPTASFSVGGRRSACSAPGARFAWVETTTRRR